MKIKILIVQDSDWIRRNPGQQHHLAERLVLKGHAVKVIDYEILWATEGKKEFLSERSVLTSSRIFKNVKIDVIRPSILKIPILDYFSMTFTYWNEIINQIKEYNPDIIISNEILTTFLAYRAAKNFQIPTIFYSNDIEHKLIPYKFLQPIGKLIESNNISKADLVISINEGLREYTIRMGADPKRTLVISAGIDLQKYNPKIDGKPIRKKYEISENDIVLFYMGWLYHFSGLKEVIRELEKFHNIKCLIVGDGDAFDELRMLIKEYRLGDRIVLTGKQPYDSIPNFISCADICILPAYNNDIMRNIVPIKMYDYMAMQKPVIATKLPGIMREFGEGNGVIYIDRPEDAVEKAMELINSGKLIEEGIKARKFAEQYSWDKIVNQFEEALGSLIRSN